MSTATLTAPYIISYDAVEWPQQVRGPEVSTPLVSLNLSLKLGPSHAPLCFKVVTDQCWLCLLFFNF